KTSYGFTGRYTGVPFPFENNLDCELYSEGNIFDKLFKRREVSSEETGRGDSSKVRKKRRWLRLFKRN
ncbi:MAG TPA: hypothetical protein VL947_11820, partial [Cytophagales bacterium]|nr:hypothetical protein [Cytophagales bacterium]